MAGSRRQAMHVRRVAASVAWSWHPLFQEVALCYSSMSYVRYITTGQIQEEEEEEEEEKETGITKRHCVMQFYKEKISNMASAAKEHITICKATVQEKAEKATARTKEEKAIARERRKAKEAKAKMQLHREKAEHAARKHNTKHSHLHTTHTHQGYSAPAAPAPTPVYHPLHHPQPVGATTAPTYPPGPKYC